MINKIANPVLFISDAGCPLSSNYKETSKHLPIPSGEFQPTIYYRNGKQLNENDEQFIHLESQIKHKKKHSEENKNNLKQEKNRDEEPEKNQEIKEKVVRERDKLKSNKKNEIWIKRGTEENNIGEILFFLV